VHASFLNRIPGSRRHYPLLLPLMNRAFAAFDLTGFDLVLSSSHACAKNVTVPDGALHVCYCHTPIRYAWDPAFLRGESVRPIAPLLAPLLRRLRRQDLAGAAGVDAFVANSDHVADRIRRYYGREATVVHPPIDVEHYLGLPRAPETYYLAFGRVVPYKRVDLVVAACERLGRPLKVAGDGRAMGEVRAVAGPHTELLGRVDDARRDGLLAGARGLLFAAEEDFGIVPVEAQAAGVPVIAYGSGGARESVIDGRTGVLFDAQDVDSISAAIERFEALTLEPRALRDNAARFGRERFRDEMAATIDAAAGSA
jgi:glycosyltransferase involved in cell wall biosynthesis